MAISDHALSLKTRRCQDYSVGSSALLPRPLGGLPFAAEPAPNRAPPGTAAAVALAANAEVEGFWGRVFFVSSREGLDVWSIGADGDSWRVHIVRKGLNMRLGSTVPSLHR